MKVTRVITYEGDEDKVLTLLRIKDGGLGPLPRSQEMWGVTIKEVEAMEVFPEDVSQEISQEKPRVIKEGWDAD